MKVIHHQGLTLEKWQKFSLFEQLGNIGSEIGRTKNWQYKDKQVFENAVLRALELFDLTLEDPRWRGRTKEIALVREVFCDIIGGKKMYKIFLQDLEKYFMTFALAARKRHIGA